MYWTANALRADNANNMIIATWIESESSIHGKAQTHVLLNISSETTTNNPYGIFRLDFVSYAYKGNTLDTSKVLDKGFIETKLNAAGQVELHYIDQNTLQGGKTYGSSLVLRRTSTTEGLGSAIVTYLQSDENSNYTPVSTPYDFSYNANYFYRNTDGKKPNL